MTPAPPCSNCGSPLVDATGDWRCHRCQRLWPASYFDVVEEDDEPTEAWGMVTCSDCGRHYRCTPWDDFYAGDRGGVCERCLVTAAGLDPDRTITVLDVTDG